MKKTKMLKKNYEFKNILSKGIYYSSGNLVACVKKNNKDYNLLGLAISVKIGKAVTRNKIKRLIKENYRILEKDLKKGYSIVFLWKKNSDAKNANFSTINNDINIIFNKSNLKK